ncbi:MAG: T6SS phospholipase effector Tle1-like catalytic domain-containing protein, partial [Mycobacterium sp.]
ARCKRIVVCLDGTANQIGAGNLTNVAKFFEMLEKDDPASQLAYYDPGVGTLAPASAHLSLSRTMDLLFEKAFGMGLKDNVAQAYRYVMQHWRPGDALYIFGFSRGAYTARALAGMLLRPGLMRPGSENLLPYAVGKVRHQSVFHPGRVRPLGRVRPRVLLAHRR